MFCCVYPIPLSKKARAVSTSAYKCFAAADEEWEECDSVMWTITSNYLQRGLKSCLVQISSQTCNQNFLRGRAGSPWIMVVLMWLHASAQIMSSTFHKIMVRFASSGLLLPVLNIVLPTWNKFSSSKSTFVHICVTGAVVTYQQVFLCLHVCLSLHRRSRLSLFSCLSLAPPTPLVSPRWPWDATRRLWSGRNQQEFKDLVGNPVNLRGVNRY